MCSNPCRVIDTRRTDSPEIAEAMADYHEARKIAQGKSFQTLERRHLLALNRRVDEMKQELISLNLELTRISSHHATHHA